MNSKPSISGEESRMVSVWRYRVKPGRTTAFLRAYGPDGSWVNLFRQSDGYLGTELLQDNADPGVFVTIDRWQSRQAYKTFRSAFAAQYLALDTICSELTEEEEQLLEGSLQGGPPGS